MNYNKNLCVIFFYVFCWFLTYFNLIRSRVCECFFFFLSKHKRFVASVINYILKDLIKNNTFYKEILNIKINKKIIKSHINKKTKHVGRLNIITKMNKYKHSKNNNFDTLIGNFLIKKRKILKTVCKTKIFCQYVLDITMEVSCATTVPKSCHVYKSLVASKKYHLISPAVNRGIGPVVSSERERAVD